MPSFSVLRESEGFLFFRLRSGLSIINTLHRTFVGSLKDQSKMAQELLFVRHGKPASEYCGRFIGATDVSLASEGVLQTKGLALRLGRRLPARCYCSPLTRTLQTAEILSESLGLPIQLDPDLREADFGRWEGFTFDQVAAVDLEAVNRWALGCEDFGFPGGELLRDFRGRVRRAADRLAADSAERILVVTHGGVIRAMICHFLCLEPQQYVLFEPRYGALTTIRLSEGRGVLSGLNELSPEEGF